MPVYEYECGRCRRHFELKQSFDAETVSSCPECQSVARRVLLPVGIVFKGSGFYTTDNREGGGGQIGEERPKSETTKGAADTAKETVGASDKEASKNTTEKPVSKNTTENPASKEVSS